MRSVANLLITRCLPVLLCTFFSMSANAAVFVVNSTADAADANTADGICQTAAVGQCTLRAAIEQANATPNVAGVPDQISFAIGSGTQTISVPVGFGGAGELPSIGEAVTIDATTQPGYSGTPLIVLTNSMSPVDGTGLTVIHSTGTTTVRGFVINNFYYGISLFTSGTGLVEVKGNYIGTDATGNAALGTSIGIRFGNSSNNIIGGATVADRNVIGGSINAILIITGATNNIVKGNYICINAAGTAGICGFDAIGVTGPNNIIGGVLPGEGNTIAFSNNGVTIFSSAAINNSIRGNSIFSNAAMGIDLDTAGVTANDAGDGDAGANNLQNYPVLTYEPAFKAVTATLNSTASTVFNIDFYSNPVNERQGKKYLGTRQITTDGSGNGSVGATFSQEVPAGEYVTATATRTVAPLDTSEFAAQLLLAAPTAATSTISGRIADPAGAGISGATVSLAGTQTRKTITDNAGKYRFDNVETGGFYTVTPTRISYSFGPASRSFSLIGDATEAEFTATPNSLPRGNAIDTAEYFVRQHYLDFLGREPDEDGFKFWSDQILSGGIDAACIERRTINVSAAYFLSIEFQETGGLVDGLYRASYGRAPLFSEFWPDTATIADKVVVADTRWSQMLAANKQEFLEAWVERPAFRAAYDSLSHESYVERLVSNTRVEFTSAERAALVAGLENKTLTRAGVLGRVAQNERFMKAKFKDAFVMMQYFGYLRRDPDSAGFDFWLGKLNQFGGNFEQAEMVKAFLLSSEYRARFAR